MVSKRIIKGNISDMIHNCYPGIVHQCPSNPDLVWMQSHILLLQDAVFRFYRSWQWRQNCADAGQNKTHFPEIILYIYIDLSYELMNLCHVIEPWGFLCYLDLGGRRTTSLFWGNEPIVSISLWMYSNAIFLNI